MSNARLHKTRDDRHVTMTAERFLSWAEARSGRFELVEGRVMMQAGASRDHERVAKRVFIALSRQIDETAYDVNKGDFGVRVGDAGRGSVLYPDVLVDLQSSRGDERATTTPLIVVEVLSPSTDLAHHIDKLEKYKIAASLRHYLVFDQKRPVVHLWSKSGEGWPGRAVLIQGLDEVISVPDFSATISLAEIYRPLGGRSGSAIA